MHFIVPAVFFMSKDESVQTACELSASDIMLILTNTEWSANYADTL